MKQSQTNNLHGNAPDNSEIAIVLIDVINDLEFDEGNHLPSIEIDFAAYDRQHAKANKVASQR